MNANPHKLYDTGQRMRLDHITRELLPVELLRLSFYASAVADRWVSLEDSPRLAGDPANTIATAAQALLPKLARQTGAN